MLYDRDLAARYRESDDRAAERGELDRTTHQLREISRSFGREISVLDLGCGTGRFLHAVENARRLLGVDASPEMLVQASRPVRAAEVSAKEVTLIEADIRALDLSPGSFDFIYSIGVLGNHVPFDEHVCASVHRLLTADGRFFFSVVDADSKPKSWKRRVAEPILPLLPGRFRQAATARAHTFYMTRAELERVLARGGFARHEIHRQVSSSPDWTGAVFECTAWR
jgi:SAM-dependent methyltransferase